MGPSTSVIWKGSSLLDASFLEGYPIFKFRPSSHTLSPLVNGVKPRVDLLAIFCLASSCAAAASFLASLISFTRCSAEGAFVLSNARGMSFGSYPIMR